MGKGEGKGGCGVFDALGDCIQCIAGTICCCLITGPILIIIGIVFIASAFSNDRAEKIDEFKLAVQTWNNGQVDGFASTTDSDWKYSLANSCSNGLPAKALTRSSSPEDLGNESDEREDFASYERVSFIDDSPGVSSASTNDQQQNCKLDVQITFKNAVVGNVSTPVVEISQMSFDQLNCRRSSGNNQSNRNTENQLVEECRSTCRSRGGEPTGGSSIGSFQCKMSLVPKTVCVRVKKSGDTWAAATGTLPERPGGASGSGCFLAPLGTQWEAVEKQASTSSGQLSVPVQVRSERDPYLYFLDISKGLKDFGLTTGEKLQIGFACLIIGAIIQAMVCCACCMIVKFARGIAGGKTQRPENPVGGALYDVSAKYGNYIPGGAAVGHPVAQGIPAQGVPAHKPHQAYDGNASYDTPGNYNAQQSGPYGGGGYSPYGGGQYSPAGGQAGAPPPGYPSAV